MGERSHLLSPDVNLDTHVGDVVNCIHWEELSDVILCGHSYGGAVIRGAADRVADRIGALVYLDAFVPDHGQSVHDLLPEEMRDRQLELATTVGDGWKVPPIAPEAFQVNLQDREWVGRQCTFQPLGTFQQSLSLTGALDQIKNVTYILAGGWGPSPFPVFYDKAKTDGWKTLTIDCGHDVMLDEPEQLVKALVSVSASSASA